VQITDEHGNLLFGDGWWNHPPWSLNPDGALLTMPVGSLGLPGTATYSGGPNGWDKLVALNLDLTFNKRTMMDRTLHRLMELDGEVWESGRWAPSPEDYPRSESQWSDESSTDFLRVDPEHLPLRAWTPDEIRKVTDQAHALLILIDETWQVGRALRAARVDLNGELEAPTVGTINDKLFAELYEIVSERHAYGYAKILAKMLSVEPQSVRNRVNQLRKVGLIEPAISRGNT